MFYRLNKTKILIIIILFSIFILFNQCLAEELPNLEYSQGIMKKVAGGEGIGYNTEQGFEATLGNIIRIFLSLLGIFFLILIIIGGYEWMMAGGNEETIQKAKKRIINATIGLAIVLMAYAITYFISYYLTQKTGYNR